MLEKYNIIFHTNEKTQQKHADSEAIIFECHNYICLKHYSEQEKIQLRL